MFTDSKKTVVLRFNRDVIERGDRDAFEALMAPTFINRSAPPGAPSDGESMWNTFDRVLRPAIAGLTVTIHDQIAEGDKVTTRKTISGTHDAPPPWSSAHRETHSDRRHRHRAGQGWPLC